LVVSIEFRGAIELNIIIIDFSHKIIIVEQVVSQTGLHSELVQKV